jgi:hypothetical protein
MSRNLKVDILALHSGYLVNPKSYLFSSRANNLGSAVRESSAMTASPSLARS